MDTCELQDESSEKLLMMLLRMVSMSCGVAVVGSAFTGGLSGVSGACGASGASGACGPLGCLLYTSPSPRD